MGDQDAGPGLDQGIDGVLDLLLGNGIQGGGGLVKDQEGRILQKDPGNGDPLLLSSGELEAPVAHHGIQARGLGLYEIIDVGLAAGLDEVFLRGVRPGVEEVVPDGPVEQVGLLADDPDMAAQEGQVQLPDVMAAEGDRPSCRIIEPGDQVDQGGLAGARGPDHGDAVPAPELKGDIRQDLPLPVIGKVHMVKGHAAVRAVGRKGVLGVPDLRRHVIVFKDPGEHGHGPDPVHLDVEQLVDGPVHLAQKAYQDRDVADGQAGIILHHQDAAHQVEEHGPHAGGGADDDHEPPARHALPDVQLHHPAVGVLIALVLIVLPAEEPDQELAADRQGLVQDPVDLIVDVLGLPGQAPPGPPGGPGGNDKEGDDQDAHGGQDRILPVHDHHRHHQSDGVGQDILEGIGDDPLDPVYVAGHPGNDIALAGGGKEPLGHLLEVPVHAAAHVIGDMLGDPVVQVGFQDPDQVGPQRDGQGQEDQGDQGLHVPADQALVNDPARQDRGKEGQGGGYKDQEDHQSHLLPVGPEIGQDPEDQFLRHFGLGRLFFFCQIPASHGAAVSSWCHCLPSFFAERF